MTLAAAGEVARVALGALVLKSALFDAVYDVKINGAEETGEEEPEEDECENVSVHVMLPVGDAKMRLPGRDCKRIIASIDKNVDKRLHHVIDFSLMAPTPRQTATTSRKWAYTWRSPRTRYLTKFYTADDWRRAQLARQINDLTARITTANGWLATIPSTDPHHAQWRKKITHMMQARVILTKRLEAS